MDKRRQSIECVKVFPNKTDVSLMKDVAFLTKNWLDLLQLLLLLLHGSSLLDGEVKTRQIQIHLERYLGA